MSSFLKLANYKLLLTITLVGFLSISSIAQNVERKDERISEAVVELKNFSEEKMLPSLNHLLNKNSGIKLQGYCLGQDLVVFNYDKIKFNSAKEVAILLEDNGYNVYLKENMTYSEVIANCKSPYKKIKE